jgi:hypothetical protein
MNLQQILDPIAKLVDETFISILVPISDLVNWAVIALGLFGLALWIKLQQSYTAKAKRDNTLV